MHVHEVGQEGDETVSSGGMGSQSILCLNISRLKKNWLPKSQFLKNYVHSVCLSMVDS